VRPRRGIGLTARRQRGQASIELLAGVPALLIAALVALQMLATGYAASLADGAAEAGALAAAAGTGPRAAARASLPGWARGGAEVRVSGDRLSVSLPPPSLIGALGERLRVSSTAEMTPR
jgi:hypothetical protein